MKEQLRLLFPRCDFRSLLCKMGLLTLTGLITSQLSMAQQWSILGNESQVSSVASYYTSITVLEDLPYVVYVEGTSTGGIGKVKRRNAASGVWEQVGGNLAATNISYTKIYHDNNNRLYVTYIDNSNSSRLAVLTYNSVTLAWEPLLSGNPYVSPGSVTYTSAVSITRSGMAFDSSNVPYITFSDRSAATGYPFVLRFVSGAWQTVGGGAVSADWAAAINIALDNTNVPYLVYVQQALSTSATGTIKNFRFNTISNTWEDVSPPSPVLPGSATTGATTAVRHTNIAMDSTGNPLLSYFNTSSSNKSTIIRYNRAGAAWNWIGTTSTRDANNNSIINDKGGNVYNMFSDALINGGLSNMVRVFKLQRGSAAFTELKTASSTRGIDSTGDNSTVARPVSIANLSIAVGSDTAKPFIVYTKTNAGGIVTPIVQVFGQGIVTRPVINITASSATTGGDISSDGGSAITERGIVYSTNINPSTADTKVTDALVGTGLFTSTLSGLIPATTYHVRAYYINGTATIYGNDLAFFTPAPDPNSVTVTDNGSTVILNNGIVKATITKVTATVTSLVYNGLELINGGFGGGSIYWSWNMPNYQNPSGCSYTLTTDPHNNNFDYAEIKMHMVWNGSPSTAAMDVDVYYSLLKNGSGIYASATLSHPAAYPENPGGEWRMSSYPNPRFNWMSVDSLRNRMMPDINDMNNSVAVPGAPVEVTRLTSGIYNNRYECKYDYSADFGDINAWGWSSTADNIGLWVTAPSKEYYPGGPKKRELMCHATPVLLNMLGGTHYLGNNETVVAAGEDWQKTFGPFLIYCNKVPSGTPNAPIALWNDAKAQALTEQAAWPYQWYTNPAYIKQSGRGTVTGNLVINDISNLPAANTWVGLAIPPAGSSSPTDFQNWSKNYQFWIKTDANGNFTIPDVLPGTYSLFAFGPGAAGQLSLANYATVTAGNTTNLGTVTWTPTRLAPTVWEMGTADRNAMEYRHGTDWWTSNTYPNLHWARFMDYTDEFSTDVNFTIGQSNIATDWNFVQPYDKNIQTTSPNWKVNFNLNTAPTTGTTAAVYVALAANFSAALILSVNGTNITSPSTGVVPGNSSNAMIRKGIHGAFAEVRFNFPASYLQAGANTISFTLRVTGGATSGEVMYDYLRLEAAGTSLVTIPVVLHPLTGSKADKTNILSWATETESNTTNFQVLRGNQPNPTNIIGTVPAKGNSTVYTPYTFIDHAPLEGRNYYRLFMLDKDEKKTYSNTVLLNIVQKGLGISIYPNPVSSLVYIRSFAGININYVKLYDLKGVLIYQNEHIASNQTTINTTSLSSGLYTLEVRSGDTVVVEKIHKE